MKKIFTFLFLKTIYLSSFAQLPTECGEITARNNSNGQANSCAGVSGTAMASNFSGIYAVVPPGNKTADISFKYQNTNYQTLKPYAITKISTIINGVASELASKAGPAAVPTVTGSVDALVKYCVYGAVNLPTNGLLIFELTDPETGSLYGSCAYDASCTSNCIPTLSVLSLQMSDFYVSKTSNAVTLNWQGLNQSAINSFEIESSNNGSTFKKIGSVFSSSAHNYSFDDLQAASGITYYRIKVILNGGGFQYSNVIKFKNTSGTSLSNIHYNTSSNKITADANFEKAGIAYFQLTNLSGQVLLNKKISVNAGTTQLTLDLPPAVGHGVYALKILYDNNLWVEKIVK